MRVTKRKLGRINRLIFLNIRFTIHSKSIAKKIVNMKLMIGKKNYGPRSDREPNGRSIDRRSDPVVVHGPGPDRTEAFGPRSDRSDRGAITSYRLKNIK